MWKFIRCVHCRKSQSLLDAFVSAHVLSCSVVSDSLQPHGLYPAKLLCPWDFPGKNTGVSHISFSGGSSQPRDRIHVSCIVSWILYHYATWEALQSNSP